MSFDTDDDVKEIDGFGSEAGGDKEDFRKRLTPA